MSRIAALCLWLVASPLLAQPFQVADLHTGPGPALDGDPAGMIELQPGLILFAANDGLHGRELWRTDGTPGNTHLVRDIHPGAQGSNPVQLTRLGDRVCFTADDGTHGRELWCSDGSETGTLLVRDIVPGPEGSRVNQLTAVGSTLFFRANDRVHGEELWRSDGTEAGTVLVTDLRPGPLDSFPDDLVNLDGVLLFSAFRDDVGRELFRSTGSAGSTTVVRDIRPGTAGSSPARLTVHAGQVYFAADNGSSGRELWRSNGTLGGTVQVADLRPGSASSSPSDLISSGVGLLLTAFNGTNTRLYRSDGTGVGTVDLGIDTFGLNVFGVATVGGLVLFSGPDQGLWRTDGSASGTAKVLTINPSFESILQISQFDDLAYFSINDPSFGFELFRSDGTAAGTFRVGDINPGSESSAPREMQVVGNTLMFRATRNDIGRELWRLNAGSLTPTLVANIAPEGGSSFPRIYGVVGKHLLFSADTEVFGRELWRSDGTAAGTDLVLDADPGVADALDRMDRDLVRSLVRAGVLYYIARAPGPIGAAQQLWRSDGSTAGTFPLPVPDPFGCCDFGGATAAYFSATDNLVYFPTRNPDTGDRNLVRSDGTAAGTQFVHPGIDLRSFGQPRAAAGLGNILLFNGLALGENQGEELFRTDGSQAGTTLVRDINPGAGASRPSWLTRVGSHIYFSAFASGTGRELYRSDGSFSGTHLVRDIAVGNGSSLPIDLTEHAGLLYFSADDGVSGRELWRSDGSPAGTQRVADLVAGLAGSVPSGLYSAPAGLYFAAYHPDRGVELWLTDGSAPGTRMLGDLDPGPGSGLPHRHYETSIDSSGDFGAFLAHQDFEYIPYAPRNVSAMPLYGRPVEFATAADGRVVFRGCTRAKGCQVWISNGTTMGTYRLTDFGPAPGGASPGHLTVLGDAVYFAATDEAGQRELWGLTLPPANDILFRNGLETLP